MPNIDSELARVAFDAARCAVISSQEAFERIIEGIESSERMWEIAFRVFCKTRKLIATEMLDTQIEPLNDEARRTAILKTVLGADDPTS